MYLFVVGTLETRVENNVPTFCPAGSVCGLCKQSEYVLEGGGVGLGDTGSDRYKRLDGRSPSRHSWLDGC